MSEPTYAELEAENERLKTALGKINDIRNSIIGLQTVNWSEHVYPLVAALNEAGIEGMPYPAGELHFGTMLERTNKAEAERDRLKAERERVRGFVESEAWSAMNQRRAELIDRDVQKHNLSETEKAELATLQTAVDVLIGVAHPAPELDWPALVEAMSKTAKRVEAERDALLAYIVRDSGLPGAFRFHVLLPGVVNNYATRDEAVAFLNGELERIAEKRDREAST